MPLEPIRFVDGRAMLLAGIRRHHSFAQAAQGIMAQWRDFEQQKPIPHQVGTAEYGVMCGADLQAQTMEYMCAVEVSEFDPAATHLGRMRVPPQYYAVFEPAHVSALRQTWDAIWNEWTPRSGYTAVHGPEFEVYGERFDPRTGTGAEIWATVRPPSAV